MFLLSLPHISLLYIALYVQLKLGYSKIVGPINLLRYIRNFLYPYHEFVMMTRTDSQIHSFNTFNNQSVKIVKTFTGTPKTKHLLYLTFCYIRVRTKQV